MKNLILILLITALTLPQALNAAVSGGEVTEPSVTVYMYPPSRPLNWESPGRLLYSFIFSEVDKALINSSFMKFINGEDDIEFSSDFGQPGALSTRYFSSMGHTIGHVYCELPDGRIYDKWASFSGQNFVSVDKENLIKKQLGLGVLFYDYNDGHIISGVENKVRISNYRNVSAQKPHYMRFMLGTDREQKQVCAKLAKMISFFESFNYPEGTTIEQLNARGPMNNLFFNTMDPYDTYLKRQSELSQGKKPTSIVGGGCAPFGAALVKMAGFYEPFYEKHWKRYVGVSEKLIGGIPDDKTGDIRKVPVSKLLALDLLPDPSSIFDLFPGDFLTKLFNHSLAKDWNYAHQGYKNRELKLYDPKRIWNLVDNNISCLNDYSAENCILHDRYINSGFEKTVTMGPTEVFTDSQSGESNEVRGIVISR